MAATRTPTETTASQALARCVEPIGAAEFLAEYWEQRPLAVPRAEEGRFDDLLSVADVERLVSSGGLRTPGLRLVKEGGTIAESAYATDISWRPKPFLGMADPDRVATAFADGATIVLQALHHTWPPLARFCRALEQELGSGVQANSYYTPRRSQGFAVHHDTHDVFVLQVAGEKHWRVYEPLLELPLKAQRWTSSLGTPGPTVLELTLRAGDTLYLPRGWLHEAETSQTDSLHLTIGITAHTWLDAAKDALARLGSQSAFRPDVATRGDGDGLAAALAEQLDPELVEHRRRRRFVDTRRPIREDGISQLRALALLDGDTVLERRETVIADLDQDDGGPVLVFEGKEIRFPAHAGPELRACFEREEPFRSDDLSGELDADGRLVLVRRLVREGFLRVRLGDR
jgi:ribosomal protein L16 Arg81 hydroxylase